MLTFKRKIFIEKTTQRVREDILRHHPFHASTTLRSFSSPHHENITKKIDKFDFSPERRESAQVYCYVSK